MSKLKKIFQLCQKIFIFGPFIPLSNLFIVYGRFFLSKDLLHKVSDLRKKKVQSIILKNVTIENEFVPTQAPSDLAPIWWCWFQGVDKLPLIPQLCLNSLRLHANGHPIHIITLANYKEYVDIPQHIVTKVEKGTITLTHFSDILRMALVAKFGGMWLDSTMLVLKDLPEDIFVQPYFTIKTKPFGFFVSQCRWTGFCFAAHKNSILPKSVLKIFSDYWLHQNYLVDYFLIDNSIDIMYNRNTEVKKLIDNVSFNNENSHKLNALLCKDFDQATLEKLMEDTYLFKLSWKSYTSEQLLSNPNNFYHHLLTLTNS